MPTVEIIRAMSVENRRRVLALALFVDLVTFDNCLFCKFVKGNDVDHEPYAPNVEPSILF